jgi:erythromycin esterase-like protein
MDAGYAPGFHDLHLPPQRGDMTPTGVFIARALGPQAYTLGSTAYKGQEGFATGGPASRIAPALEGGLEADLHALGHPYAFVDFRSSQNDHRSPLREVQTVRAPKFESVTIADADRIYDGVFFIDHMSPATPA